MSRTNKSVHNQIRKFEMFMNFTGKVEQIS